MNDNPYKKIQPGSITPGIDAESWNRHQENAEWYERTIKHGQGSEKKKPQFQRGSGVLIRNDSDYDLSTGDVLALRGCFYDPTVTKEKESYKNEPVFIGVEPQWITPPSVFGRSDNGLFAVLLEPIKQDDTGWACIDGICSVTIDMQYQSYRYADIVSGETGKLKGYEYGGAEIIHCEDAELDPEEWEAGDKLALVRLGAFHNPMLCVVWEGELSPASTKQAWVWDDPAGGVPSDPAQYSDGREIVLSCSINANGAGIELLPNDYGWAQFSRTGGTIELITTSKQFGSIDGFGNPVWP